MGIFRKYQVRDFLKFRQKSTYFENFDQNRDFKNFDQNQDFLKISTKIEIFHNFVQN